MFRRLENTNQYSSASSRIKVCGLVFLFFGSWQAGYAQKKSSYYSRIIWENDAFQLRDATDRYYTNNTRIDIMGDVFRKNPLSWFFLHLPNETDPLYGIGIGQSMFTPTNISADSILKNDRPYAGWLYLSSSFISNDFNNQQRLSTEVDIGVIGKYSFAKETQILVHKIVNSPEPKGWDNQIKDDIGLNYYVRYEKRIFPQVQQNFDFIPNIEANAGTVTNYFGVGGYLKVGIFNDHFGSPTGLYEPAAKVNYAKYEKFYGEKNLKRDTLQKLDSMPDNENKRRAVNKSVRNLIKKRANNKFQLYFFMRPTARAVLDNSFLQGGIINAKRSVHVIPGDNFNRFYFSGEYGGVISFDRLTLSFSQFIRTAEFKGAFNQQWGCFNIIYRWD